MTQEELVGIVRAEFRRCGWAALQQTPFVIGGYDETEVCADKEMYLYRITTESEGYSLKDQGSSYFHTTGYNRTETVTAIHPIYAAAIGAAQAAWIAKTAVTADQLLEVIRLSMGDIVLPIVILPTAEETRVKEAAELAQQKAARRSQRDTTQSSVEAPSSSVNLNDPWGSLSTLKL